MDTGWWAGQAGASSSATQAGLLGPFCEKDRGFFLPPLPHVGVEQVGPVPSLPVSSSFPAPVSPTALDF